MQAQYIVFALIPLYLARYARLWIKSKYRKSNT